MPPFAAHLVQIAAAAGGLLLHLAGVPAAWLSGSVVAVALLGLAGHDRPMPRPLAEAAMLISGATIGAAITPEAIAAITRYPQSLLVLALAVVAITLGSACGSPASRAGAGTTRCSPPSPARSRR